MSLATKRRCATLAVSNPPRLSGSHCVHKLYFLLQIRSKLTIGLVCAPMQVPRPSHRSSTRGHATQETTRHSVHAAYVRSYDTSLQVLAVASHFTKQRQTCTLRAYYIPVLSVIYFLSPSYQLILTHPTAPQLLSLGARAGVLHPLGSEGTTSAPTICDRFQLGGPTNIRMFRANSLGPRDGGPSRLILSFLSTADVDTGSSIPPPFFFGHVQPTRSAATCFGPQARVS
jgi:Omp85 superfamily domain